MTKRDELLALADRCEREGAGSFDLDKAILRALGYTWRGMDYWFRDGSHTWKGESHPTQSLDAALTLVPENTFWWIGRGKVRLGEPMFGAIIEEAEIDMPAELGSGESDHSISLALCAASLRARAALLREDRT